MPTVTTAAIECFIRQNPDRMSDFGKTMADQVDKVRQHLEFSRNAQQRKFYELSANLRVLIARLSGKEVEVYMGLQYRAYMVGPTTGTARKKVPVFLKLVVNPDDVEAVSIHLDDIKAVVQKKYPLATAFEIVENTTGRPYV